MVQDCFCQDCDCRLSVICQQVTAHPVDSHLSSSSEIDLHILLLVEVHADVEIHAGMAYDS